MACKPDSVSPRGQLAVLVGSVIICLEGRLPDPSCSLPEGRSREGESAGRTPATGPSFCLTLLPMGVAWPRRLLSAPVVSYTTFSPLRPERSRSRARGLFLWSYPRVTPPGRYPASHPMESGLSSPQRWCASPGHDHPANSGSRRSVASYPTAKGRYVNARGSRLAWAGDPPKDDLRRGQKARSGRPESFHTEAAAHVEGHSAFCVVTLFIALAPT